MTSVGNSLYDPVGTGLVTSVATNPIIGDPEPCIRMAATGYLSTGELAAGESGDAGGLTGFAIEMWFKTDSVAPGTTQYLAKGPNVGGGNRQWLLFLNTTGTIGFTLRDATTGAITVTSSAITAGQWYHIVALADTAFHQQIYLNGAQSVSFIRTAPSVIVPLVAGATADLQIGDSAGSVNYFYFSDVAFYRGGVGFTAFATRILAHYVAGTQRGFNTQASGARINSVLDTAGSTASRRIGAGARSVTPRYMVGQAPLEMVREAVSGEAVDAAFFTAADGTLVFLDSAHRSSSPYNTPQATFGDGAGELPYVDVNVVYDESNLANDWNVTAEGTAKTPAQTQSASDGTSIARYFKRSSSLTGLPVVSDSDAQDVANAMLAKYKDPMYRITQLTFNTVDASVAEAIFRREIGDKITVKRTPPGGGSRISQDLFIQKVDVSGANDGQPWSVTFGVSPV